MPWRPWGGQRSGEMALLEPVCVPHVVRAPASRGIGSSRDGFRMLLAQRNATVFTLQGRITLALCRRLRISMQRSWRARPRQLPRGIARERRRRGSAQCVQFQLPGRFSPILPVFRGIEADDIEALTAHVEVRDAPRGAVLVEQGRPSTACYIVIRGAIEVSTAQTEGGIASVWWVRAGSVATGAA